MPHEFLSELIFLVIAAFVGGFVARSLKFPPVIGYIVSGIIFGIIGKNSFASYESLVVMSEVGVALLLFTLGFEISIDALRKINRKVFIVGILNVILVAASLVPLLALFGLPKNVAVLFAILFSFSSTAVIVKILEEKGMLGNFPGKNVFIYLLIQDLFIIPVIMLLPILFPTGPSTTGFVLTDFLVSLAQPVFLFIAILAAGRFLLPRFLHLVFRYPSHELSILATIFTASLSISLLTWVGLPVSIAAFLAGVLISEQGKNLTPLAEIRPFRDLFLVLFFVMTGMLVNFGFLLSNLPYILGLCILVVFIKFVVIYLLLRISSNSAAASVFISSHIANVGEFSVVIAQIAFLAHFISQEEYNLALSVFILSLILIPIWLKYFRVAFEKVAKVAILGKIKDEDMGSPLEPFENHVIIAGHGRVGAETAKLLSEASIPYVAIDFNKSEIEKILESGKYAIYGDPTDEDILKAAFIEKAKFLVIALPDPFSQKRIIVSAGRLNPGISIYSRSHTEDDQKALIALGVKKTIMPEYEAGIKIGEHILEEYNVDPNKIVSLIYSERKVHEAGKNG